MNTFIVASKCAQPNAETDDERINQLTVCHTVPGTIAIFYASDFNVADSICQWHFQMPFCIVSPLIRRKADSHTSTRMTSTRAITRSAYHPRRPFQTDRMESKQRLNRNMKRFPFIHANYLLSIAYWWWYFCTNIRPFFSNNPESMKWFAFGTPTFTCFSYFLWNAHQIK